MANWPNELSTDNGRVFFSSSWPENKIPRHFFNIPLQWTKQAWWPFCNATLRRMTYFLIESNSIPYSRVWPKNGNDIWWKVLPQLHLQISKLTYGNFTFIWKKTICSCLSFSAIYESHVQPRCLVWKFRLMFRTLLMPDISVSFETFVPDNSQSFNLQRTLRIVFTIFIPFGIFRVEW